MLISKKDRGSTTAARNRNESAHTARSDCADPAISVTAIVATYNRCHMLGDTIDSLLAQSRPLHQIIVVNDGSTDATRAVAQSYGERILYLEKANGGKSTALNAALEHATSSHVWFFDDDDIALPEAVALHVDALREHPSSDFTYSPQYYFEGDPSLQSIRESQPLRFPAIAPGEFLTWTLGSRFLPTHMQGMVIARRVFDTIGGFDPVLLRSQDLEMVLRIARDFRPCRIDEPTWAMRRHDGPRGPGFSLHPASDSYAVWWQYKRQIFSDLYSSLRLEEYLPNNCSLDAGTQNRRRARALLQRALVMTTHGLFQQARSDLLCYCTEVVSTAEPATTEEQLAVLRLADMPSSAHLPPPYFYFTLGKATACGHKLLWPALKGVIWSMSRMYRKKEYRASLRSLLMLPVILSGAIAARIRVPKERAEIEQS